MPIYHVVTLRMTEYHNFVSADDVKEAEQIAQGLSTQSDARASDGYWYDSEIRRVWSDGDETAPNPDN